ncbi:MAG: tetratricopeptide repeat protein [Clostridiaceae bacterium]|nr:tetratricopeptide repeat protein [Clostridiaceae bacterium]
MDKATKYYKKALTKYHNGYIDEAINLCGASVAENNRYKAAASLKGILFYFKGDLENARELWDFNVRVNKDVVSKKYIENTRSDDKLLSIYTRGLTLINEVKIADALILLKECEESDFNVLNVSNYIAVCLIKQGEFIDAKVYLDKVLNIDKKNKMALDNIKMLKKFGIINNKFQHGPIIIFLLIVFILGSGLSIHFAKNKKIATKQKVDTVKPIDNSKIAIQKETKPEEVKKIEPEEVFPYDKIKSYIDEANYEELDKALYIWKDKSKDDRAKTLLENALVLIKDKGLKVFYDKGYKYFTDKDYKNASDYFHKVYSYGNIDYLYENGLFYLARSEENLGNINDEIKYYEEYSNTFPKGSYEATVLYNLAILYSKSDMNKAKGFAKMLLENFPNEDYNNSIMRDILAK